MKLKRLKRKLVRMGKKVPILREILISLAWVKKQIKILIANLCKKYVGFRKVVRFFRRKKKQIKYFKYYHLYKVNPKIILFESFMGRSYSCNPKALYKQICQMDEFKDYTFVWAFKHPIIEGEKYPDFDDPRTILIKYKSKRYYKYCSMAKYWLTNSLIDESIKKKPNQVYIQTWHGTPLKKLRCDIKVDGAVLNTRQEIVERNNRDVVRFDYFLSPSPFATKCFVSAFNLKQLKRSNIIVEQGYPRNDYLKNYKPEEVKKIKRDLGINKNKKIILYAPTFRDNEHQSGLGYTYSLHLDFDKLKETLSKDYVILFRTHYFVSNSFDFTKYEGFIYNVSDYDDINDLYIISDLLITDYSSVFFDFANLKRPMLFYMYDLDLYQNELRDFYIDLKELPGPIVKDEDSLIKEIKNIDTYFKKYQKTYDKFSEKYNLLDDGNCSERVVKEIWERQEKIEQEK